MFVIAIHPEDNTVVLGTKEELQGKSFFAKEINLMKYAKIPDGLEVTAKIRYRNEGKKASLYPEDNRLRVVFHETTRIPLRPTRTRTDRTVRYLRRRKETYGYGWG